MDAGEESKRAVAERNEAPQPPHSCDNNGKIACAKKTDSNDDVGSDIDVAAGASSDDADNDAYSRLCRRCYFQ